MLVSQRPKPQENQCRFERQGHDNYEYYACHLPQTAPLVFGRRPWLVSIVRAALPSHLHPWAGYADGRSGCPSSFFYFLFL